MDATNCPAIFVSHGPPKMVVDPIPVRGFLEQLGRDLARARAVLCVSAHWITAVPSLTGSERPETIHDFFGFAPELYQIAYPAPGDPALAARVERLVQDAGFDCDIDPARGLDHGAWQPLILMYPQARVPVVQLSLIAHAGAADHYRLGRALAPLLQDGVLVLASGTATHNLAAWRRAPTATPPWARAFEAWLIDAVERGDHDGLIDYLHRAPEAQTAHPSDDHFLPLLVALGAGGPGPGRTLHRGFAYGSLSMAAFAFGAQ
jgi:4,5-DOPA dioxygenase extradiol